MNQGEGARETKLDHFTNLLIFRNLCGHRKSHGRVAQLGACTDPDLQRTGGQPNDGRAAESPTAATAAAAHDDSAAPPPSTGSPTATDNCPAADDCASTGTTTTGAAAAASNAQPGDAEAQVALLHALSQRLRDEERPDPAHEASSRWTVHGASACLRVRQGVLPEEPFDVASASAHGHEAQCVGNTGR